MSEKKIDNLFQRKFKDFDELPNEKVWKAIEASLDKKEKNRKVIPIWWKLGGVAALLAIVFYVFNPLGDQGTVDAVITDTENNHSPESQEGETQKEDNFILSDKDTEKVADAPKSKALDNQTKNQDNDRTHKKNTPSFSVNDEKKIADSKKNMDKGSSKIGKEKTNQETTQVAAVSTTDILEKEARQAPNKPDTNQLLENRDADVTDVDITKTEKAIELEKVVDEAGFKEKNKDAVAENTVAEPEKTTELLEENNKKSIFEAIAEQEEEIIVAENGSGKWSVGPSVAPVYFDSFGEGSPIHSNFASNSKSGNVNFSYGLSVAYNVSKRLSVRTGVHKVDYGYDTNEIVFSSSIDASTSDVIDNINYAASSRNLVVQSKTEKQPASQAAIFEFDAAAPSLDGRMVQEFGYLEVPLELNYALVDKKVGVNLIGGVSSLFLVDNSIALISDGLATDVGEANNLNSVNFSTNVGVGINYKFAPKVQLNLEPVFKYQLNTFSDTAGDFRPFSVGIYSGLNFKF
ncbi:outer membrane beta-barrel protein [Spongiimicrobium sp. 3-5]|uniref:outer membrane beta-barrel protein n=1 Tax=Spongiimicrobium sp. 3-5 TaxID=3332596 RepID=UPI003980C2E8